jgi:hypothetical protein
MKRAHGIFVITICSLFAAGMVAAAEPEEAEITVGGETCCFENPRFSGTCQVTPGPEESCGDILAYLNNPNSVGKNYCGNTKVRGGWTTVTCEGTSTAAASKACRIDKPVE